MGLIQSLKQMARIGGRLPYEGYTAPGDDDVVGYSATVAKALDNAYLHPIVCIVVSWLVKQVSSTPLVILRTSGEDDQERITSHPILTLLDAPSEFMSGRELLAATVRDMLTSRHGQAFWRKERLNNGQLSGFTLLSSHLVEVKGSREELITHYEYKPGGPGEPVRYESDEIVQIRLEPNPRDPKNGLSPLVCVADELLLDSDSQRFISDSLNQGGAPGGFLVPPQDVVMTDELAAAIRKYVRDSFKGAKRGEIGVLKAFMGYISTGLNPSTIGVKSFQETSVSRVCGALGVHPVVVGVGVESGQARVGAATMTLERAAWTDAVIPTQESIGQQIERQILPEFVDEAELEQYAIKWDRSDVLAMQPDMLREAQRWALNVSRGIATRYEAKVGQGMDADESDMVYLLPLNIVPTPADAPPILPAPPVSEGGEDEVLEQARNLVAALSLGADSALKAISGIALRAKQVGELVSVLDRDREELEAVFSQELFDAFEDLGRRAEAAFRETFDESGELRLSHDLAILGIAKQDPEELTREVNAVLRALNISQWEQGVLIPAYDNHTLRTLNVTVGSINSTLGLEVNLPDPVQNRILREGGLRRGLTDFTEQSREALFRAIEEGREAGDGALRIARRIREQVPSGPYPNAGSRYRATVIAKTETANAQNASTRAAYEESDAVSQVLVMDGDLDEVCAAVAGRTYSFEDLQEIENLGHPNCTRRFLPVIDDE